MCNRGEFFVKSKETKQGVALLVKEKVTSYAKVLDKMELLLEESKGVVHDELPERLPPMKNIQAHIDDISGENLPNILHYRINPKESNVPKG